MDLIYELSMLIKNSQIEQDIINERNCDNIIEFSEKIKNKNFYAVHIEIYFLSKLMNIYIAIFNQKKKQMGYHKTHRR